MDGSDVIAFASIDAIVLRMSGPGEQIELGFGVGHFISPVYGDSEFVDIADDPENPNIRLQAALAAYTNGCPIARELMDPETGRGPEAMLERYASLNFWFVHITEIAYERNEDLYYRLVTPFPRQPGEPVGRYEPDSVSEDYRDMIPPMGTLYGWALPRLLIKQMGDNESQEETVTRLDRGLSILEQAMDDTEDPMVLLARFAEGISQADVEPTEVLRSILSTGWFEEQNALSMIDALRAAMRDHAPTLWNTYSQLGQAERTALDIVQTDRPMPPDFIKFIQ